MKTTYIGTPCNYGHREKYLSTNRCAPCQRLFTLNYQATPAGNVAPKKAMKKYRQANPPRSTYLHVADVTKRQQEIALNKWRSKYKIRAVRLAK
jgi:hypothetical protein